jgi:hypothetical protein
VRAFDPTTKESTKPKTDLVKNCFQKFIIIVQVNPTFFHDFCY